MFWKVLLISIILLFSEACIAKTLIIVIDPGHGGKDPGATGHQGLHEKTVVLAVAKRLALLINKQPHMRARLTRTGDYYLPLRKRLRLARKGKADVFIALHADAYFDRRSMGASTYILSPHGASSEAARWLTKRENYGDQSVEVRSVLIDLAQTATHRDSLHLARSLLHALKPVAQLRYPHVEQAPFVVLKSLDIPSVLVELGFISNPCEERRLRNGEYQNKLAKALLKGIKHYDAY